MSNNEPILDIEVDDDLNAFLTIECAQCQCITKKTIREISSNEEIQCNCGASFTLTDDGIKELQLALDDINSSLRSFGD